MRSRLLDRRPRGGPACDRTCTVDTRLMNATSDGHNPQLFFGENHQSGIVECRAKDCKSFRTTAIFLGIRAGRKTESSTDPVQIRAAVYRRGINTSRSAAATFAVLARARLRLPRLPPRRHALAALRSRSVARHCHGGTGSESGHKPRPAERSWQCSPSNRDRAWRPQSIGFRHARAVTIARAALTTFSGGACPGVWQAMSHQEGRGSQPLTTYQSLTNSPRFQTRLQIFWSETIPSEHGAHRPTSVFAPTSGRGYSNDYERRSNPRERWPVFDRQANHAVLWPTTDPNYSIVRLSRRLGQNSTSAICPYACDVISPIQRS